MMASQAWRSVSQDGVVLSSEHGQLCQPFPDRFHLGLLRNVSRAVKILCHCSDNCHFDKQGVRLIIKHLIYHESWWAVYQGRLADGSDPGRSLLS